MNEINQSFSAVSVLLFFIGLAFDYFRKKYIALFITVPIKEHNSPNKMYLKARNELIAFGVTFSLVAFILSWLLFFTSVKLFKQYPKINLIDFNLVSTLFILITIASIIILLLSVVMTFKVIFRPRKMHQWLFKSKQSEGNRA